MLANCCPWARQIGLPSSSSRLSMYSSSPLSSQLAAGAVSNSATLKLGTKGAGQGCAPCLCNRCQAPLLAKLNVAKASPSPHQPCSRRLKVRARRRAINSATPNSVAETIEASSTSISNGRNGPAASSQRKLCIVWKNALNQALRSSTRVPRRSWNRSTYRRNWLSRWVSTRATGNRRLIKAYSLVKRSMLPA